MAKKTTTQKQTAKPQTPKKKTPAKKVVKKKAAKKKTTKKKAPAKKTAKKKTVTKRKKKSTKKKAANKSQLIHDYLATHKNASAKKVQSALGKKGITVSEQLIYNVRTVIKYTIAFEGDTIEPHAVILIVAFRTDEAGVPIPLDAVGPLLLALKEFVASKRKKTIFKGGRKVHKRVTLTSRPHGIFMKCGRKGILLEPPGIPFLVQDIEANAESWQE